MRLPVALAEPRARAEQGLSDPPEGLDMDRQWLVREPIRYDRLSESDRHTMILVPGTMKIVEAPSRE
jgi:hypothetical protein